MKRKQSRGYTDYTMLLALAAVLLVILILTAAMVYLATHKLSCERPPATKTQVHPLT